MIWDETTVTVRFNEVDAYQVAWHGHYVGWLETGRLALAGRFGLDPFQLSELGYLGPVVQIELKYLRPARFGEEVRIRTTLQPTEAANLVFVSEIIGPGNRRLATGRTVHALTDKQGVLQFKLPPDVAVRLARLQEWVTGDSV